jgi:hypothetical protein
VNLLNQYTFRLYVKDGSRKEEKEEDDINFAFKEFYEEDIVETVKQTGTPEKDIRNWFQEKLITSSECEIGFIEIKTQLEE